MLLTNPVWIHHSGGAIYSIDIHPSGSKLATCGQGSEGGSGLVIIWNAEPVVDEKRIQDASCARLLSRLLHQNCVNCVRWSPTGDWLACSGDDRSLIIWEYCGQIKSAGTIGSKEAANIERYREKFRLFGHDLDVLHAEWSKDGRYLASCGMGDRIIIWDARNLPSKVVTLDSNRGGHSSIVKGVSWDPIGKFLASQSNDKTVKIWSIDNWQCIKTISDPFRESSHCTMFCRLDWSPDGCYLVAPCGLNQGGPIAQLIRRKDWDTSLDFVGHRRAVTAVRFCPRCIDYQDHKGKKLQVSIFALGSRDKTLSVWLIPNVNRPLVVLQRLFKHSILDFAWKDLHLVICSMDGSVKSLIFDTKEVGRLMDSSEMGDICEKLYSRRPMQYSGQYTNGVAENGFTFVDDYANIDDRFSLKLTDNSEGKVDNKSDSSVGMKKNTRVARLSDVHKNSQETRKQKDTDANAKPPETTSTSATLNTSQVQVESRTKTGKRRIQPLYVASLTSQETNIKPSEENRDFQSKSKEVGQRETENEINTATQNLVSPIVQSKRSENFDREEKMEVDSEEKKEVDIVPVEEQNSQELPMVLPPLPDTIIYQRYPQPEALTVEGNDETSLCIEVPPLIAQHSIKISKNSAEDVDRIDIKNNTEIKTSVLATKITAYCGDKSKWYSFIESSASSAGANQHWLVVGCFSRCAFFYTTQSGFLAMNVVFDAVPVYISLNESFVSVCSSNATISVWDVEKRKSVLSRKTLRGVLEKNIRIREHLVTDAGAPVVSLSSGKTFAYSLRLDCWQIINGNTEFIQRISNPQPSLDTNPQSRNATLVSLLPHFKSAPLKMPSSSRDVALQTMLEERLNAAYSMHLPKEFRQAAHVYVKNLVQIDCVDKLKDLFSFISREKVICGLKSDLLIRELIPLLRVKPSCLSVYRELSSRLGI